MKVLAKLIHLLDEKFDVKWDRNLGSKYPIYNIIYTNTYGEVLLRLVVLEPISSSDEINGGLRLKSGTLSPAELNILTLFCNKEGYHLTVTDL